MTQSLIRRAAIVGTGVIGMGWAVYFLAKGLEVTAFDPTPDAEARLRTMIAAQASTMKAIGLDVETAVDRLRFVDCAEAAVADAEFVQENGPEKVDFKRDLFQRMDAAAPPDVILATSSSTIIASEIQTACKHHPERVVLGHPFNPPQIIPLVEVAGGAMTSVRVVERAMEFYRAIGKHPIHLRREVRGHVANRLQAALWREAFSLVRDGVASVGDVDAAIAHGPGLRWAFLGPFTNLHLSGGEGGIGALFEKPLWKAVEELWGDLGTATVDASLAARVAEGVAQELESGDVCAFVRERDEALSNLLMSKKLISGLRGR